MTAKAKEVTLQPTTQMEMFEDQGVPEPLPHPDEGDETSSASLTTTASRGDFDYVPSADEIVIPNIRLAQGLTPEVQEGKAKPGQWILPSGQVTSEIEVLITGVRRTRALRVEGEIQCRSWDGVMGVGDPGGPCEECPMNQWTGPDGDRVPPPCTLNFQYLANYRDEDQGIGLATVTMSTKSARQAIGQLNTYVRQAQKKRPEDEDKQVYAKLGSVMVTRGNKRYNVPKIVAARVVPAGGQVEAPPAVKQLEG